VTDAVNTRIVLKGRPRGGVVTADLFARDEAAQPDPGPGQTLIRVIYLSLDPAMRGWIAEAPNYREPVPLGAVMPGFTVGEVVASKHPDYGAGDYVLGRQGWQTWALSDGGDIHRKLDPADGPISAALHVLGHTGLTAYLGLTTIGQPKPGETVVVSTAAGAVGSVVGQVAKLKGCRTVGLTGSPEKVRLCLEDFGYDGAIDYKIALLPTGRGLSETIARNCPDGVDVYFDNVGARIVVCGTTAIADVEPGAPQPTGPRLNRQLLIKRAQMAGFLVLDHLDQLDVPPPELAAWVRDGKIKHHEDLVVGLEQAPKALLRLLSGGNTGKMIVQVGGLPASGVTH
jgi:NADPH-dependent curcumin reductase CurA